MPGNQLEISQRSLLWEFGRRRRPWTKVISEASKNWRIERMALLDKSILRLAAFEIMFLEDTPPEGSPLDEAVEIGKKFGSEDSGRYINGVLDNIYNTTVKND